MIKAILFDLGDTIFDPDWNSMNKKMIKEVGISILMPANIRKEYMEEVLIGKKNMLDIFDKLLKKHKCVENPSKVIEAYKKNYSIYSPINRKMLNLIRELKSRFEILSLSNTNEIHKEVNLKRGLFKHFDKSFFSFEIGMKKPDKKIFSFILEKTGLKPTEIIFIDDNEENIENAKELGFLCIKYEGYEKLVNHLKELGIY